MSQVPDEVALTLHEHDRLPLQSFLVRCHTRHDTIRRVIRLVKPNHPLDYHPDYLTPGNRLLYWFFSDTAERGPRAHKSLGTTTSGKKLWNWIIKPGDPGYELLDAFKIICDHRQGKSVRPDLLYKALGLDLVA